MKARLSWGFFAFNSLITRLATYERQLLCFRQDKHEQNTSFSPLCFIQILVFTSVIKTELEESVAFQ